MIKLILNVILSTIILFQVAADNKNDTIIIRKINEIGNIYSYNESFFINQLNYADIPMLSNCDKYEERDGFHFDKILGYIIEINQETCLQKCCGYKKCLAVNFVSTINWCVLLASYTPKFSDADLWSGVESKHIFWSNATPNKDYSKSQKGILPTFLGQAYFTPIGLNQPTRQRRVLDGQESRPFSLPWSVVIRMFYYDENQVKIANRCTGFLIANDPSSRNVGEASNKVISAAHCFDQGSIENITVILGTHRLDVIEVHEVQVGVKTLIIHPYYQGFNENPFDVALLLLEKPVYFSEYIRPVALSSTTMSVSAKNMILLSAGWGDITIYGQRKNFLSIMLFSKPAVCVIKLDSMELRQAIVKGGHCAARMITTVTCLHTMVLYAGDSGCALLAYDTTTNQFTAYAVFSGNLRGNSFYTNIDEKNEKWIVDAFAAADPTPSCLGFEKKNGCFYPCDPVEKIFPLPQTLEAGGRVTITGTVTNETKDFVIKFLTDSEQNEHFLKIQLKFSDLSDSYGQISSGGRNWITNPQRFSYGTDRSVNVVLERPTANEYKVIGQSSHGSPVIPLQASTKAFKFITVLFNGGGGTIDKLCYQTKNKWGWLPWNKKWLP